MKRTIWLILLAIVALRMAVPSFAQSSRELRAAAISKFKADHPELTRVRVDAAREVLRSVIGTIERRTQGVPILVAETFLAELQDALGIQSVSDELQVMNVLTDSVGGLRIAWNQLHEGVPVDAAGIVVSMSAPKTGAVVERGENYVLRRATFWSPERYQMPRSDWRIHGLSAQIHPDISVANVISLQPPAVASLVLREEGGSVASENIDLRVLPVKAGAGYRYLYVYVVRVVDAHGQAFVDVRDAQTGERLDRRTEVGEISAAEGHSLTRTGHGSDPAFDESVPSACCEWVNGKVYTSHPGISGLSTQWLQVYATPGNYVFDSPTFSVVPVDGASRVSVSYPSIPFDFGLSDPRLLEVQAYYHAVTTRQWFWDKGMSYWQIPKYTINVRSPSIVGNTNGFLNMITLGGKPPTWNSPELEGAVIAHEVAHAVTYSHRPWLLGVDNQYEYYWMGEAYSDYFGIRHSFDIGGRTTTTLLEYVVTNNTGSTGGERNIDNSYSYGNIRDAYGAIVANWDNNEATNRYDASLVLSGILWDYDRDLKDDGGDTDFAPYFILHSIGNLDLQPDYENALEALEITLAGPVFMRDRAVTWECTGDCTTQAQAAFIAHGIYPGARVAEPVVSFDVDEGVNDILEEDTADETSIAPAYPNPFNPVTAVAIQMGKDGAARLEILNVQGEVVALLLEEDLPRGERVVRWDASGLASGAYLIRLVANGRVQTTKVVLQKAP